MLVFCEKIDWSEISLYNTRSVIKCDDSFEHRSPCVSRSFKRPASLRDPKRSMTVLKGPLAVLSVLKRLFNRDGVRKNRDETVTEHKCYQHCIGHLFLKKYQIRLFRSS